VRFGIKTGANEFFYLDDAKAKQWHLEEEFLRPVIKSPRECKSILIDPTTLKSRLLLCHKTKEELKGKAALEYIKWGESQGYDRRPSCRGRARWWDLGTQASFDFVVLRFRDKRNWNPVNATPSLLAGDIMFVGTWRDRSAVEIYNAVANSTLSVLISEIYGRVNLGDGLLTTYGPEIQKFDFILASAFNGVARQNLLNKFKTLSNREVKSIYDEVELPDRQDLDSIIFDVLDLTQSERDAVYKAVTDLVKARQNKADSLNTPNSREAKERRKRIDAVNNTLGIWMGIPDEVEEEVDSTYA